VQKTRGRAGATEKTAFEKLRACAMAGRPPIEDLKKAVVELVPDGVGTAAIAQEFGCSQRRVQQIVKAVGLARLVEPVHPHLDDVVCEEACRHGDNYGVAMLLGALRAHHPGWSFPRRRVLAALKADRPEALAARRHWAHRRIGRGVYVAHHFAYSWHMDLACKLQEYGIYVGALIDGDSRKALRLVALVDKLPVTIYDKLFAPAANSHGLPDQLITDKGSEWCVAAFACLLLAGLAGRSAASRRAHRFVPSKRNVRARTLVPPRAATCANAAHVCVPRRLAPWQTRVERFNYEINMRVLVPVRRLINVLELRGLLDRYLGKHVYAFSRVMQPLVQHGLDLLEAAWNEHSVRPVRNMEHSGGIPNRRAVLRPHPGGQLKLPLRFDGVHEYEEARGRPLEHTSRDDGYDSEWCARPAARARAVSAVVGDIESAWCELQDGSYTRSIDAYLCFLSYYN
jgi:hypothetical protein